jgi:hypothetical protein
MQFSEAQDRVYEQLRQNPTEKESNRVYPINLVKDSLNASQRRALAKKNYSFLNVTVPFDTKVDTGLTSDATTGDAILNVGDTTGLYSSGKVNINENVISYTGTTAITLTSCTDVKASHTSGSKVRQVYDLETDLSITDLYKPISLYINNDKIEHYDYRGKQDPQGYTIFDGNLYIPEQTKSNVAILKYKKKLTEMTNDTDEFTIPDEYVQLCIEYTLYRCYKQTGDDNWQIAFGEYERILSEMEADYSMQADNKFKRIRSVYDKHYYNGN